MIADRDTITRPRVRREGPTPATLGNGSVVVDRPWAVDYPVNGRVYTAWLRSWRDAMKFAGHVAPTSKTKTDTRARTQVTGHGNPA